MNDHKVTAVNSEIGSKHSTLTDDVESTPLTIRIDIRSAALSVIAAIAVIWFLRTAQEVVIPFVLSGMLFYALDPLVDQLQRWRISRYIGTALALGVVLGGLGATAHYVSDEAVTVMAELPAGLRKLRAELASRRGQPGPFDKVQEAVKELDQTAAEAAAPTPAPAGVMRVQVEEPSFRASEYLWTGSVGAAGLFSLGLMIVFLTYFLLVADDLFKRKLVKNIGSTLSKKKITVQIIDEIGSQIERFLLVQLFTSLVVAVVTGAVLWWMGLRQAMVWGLLAGLFNSIPYFGPVIVTVGLAIVAFLQFETVGMTVTVASVALLITTLEGWVLTPSLMGRVAQMNRMAVFGGLLFWSWMWGVWGTLLAVPITMVIKVVADHVEEFQPLGDFLGE